MSNAAMNTNELYREVYNDMMQYNLDSLIEIAAVDYNVFVSDGPVSREELAGTIATIEVNNSVR